MSVKDQMGRSTIELKVIDLLRFDKPYMVKIYYGIKRGIRETKLCYKAIIYLANN